MNFSDPHVSAAIVAGIVSLVVGAVTAIVTVVVANRRAAVDEKIAQSRTDVDRDVALSRREVDREIAQSRVEVDRELAKLKGTLDKELAEQKDRLDNKTIFAAERVAHELMMDPEWKQRSFKIIKHHIGGFEDNELRKILVRAGAIRFLVQGEEYWGLLDRNRAKVGAEQLNPDPSFRTTRLGSDGENLVAYRDDPKRDDLGGLVQG